MNLLSKIFIQKKKYKTNYDKENFDFILSNPKVKKDFNIKIFKESNECYNVVAKWSFAIYTQGLGKQPIKVRIKFVEEEKGHSLIEVYTKPRIDLMLISIIGFVILVFVEKDDYTPILLGTLVWIGCFLLFRFIYRLQENQLFEKIEKFLKLKVI